MSMESQRVVVIQDASRGVSLSAIRWALHGLSLKPGDMLTLLSILHQVNNPSTFSLRGAGKPMGYKSRVDTSMFGANRKIVDEELARKQKEYRNDEELTQISELYETQKIEFKIEVDAGPSPKAVALEAAKKLGATWVILDRQMKKDKKYFLERLSCGISRMKRDDNIEQLRGPTKANKRFLTEKNRITEVSYDEMLPGPTEVDDLFSIELFPSKHISRTLTWEARMKIAVGASRGLNHLHENTIIHRDVRPNNIFVTHDHEALLGGFGVAIEQYDSDQSLDHRVIGTFGYLAPEYTESGKTSPKTDVYSFGVVLLELITGQTSTDKRLEGKSLLGWARPLLKERKYVELIDQTIVNSHDVHKSIWMFQVAEICLSKDPQKRLSMDKVVFALENILEGKAPWGREFGTEAKSDTLNSMMKLDSNNATPTF